MMNWCSECERDQREERDLLQSGEPLLEFTYEAEDVPLPLPDVDAPGPAPDPHTKGLLLAPDSLRSRSQWEGDLCSKCGRPTFAPRIYSASKGAWFHIECRESTSTSSTSGRDD